MFFLLIIINHATRDIITVTIMVCIINLFCHY